MKSKWFGVFLIVALFLAALVPAAGAEPVRNDGRGDAPEGAPKNDNLPDPFTTQVGS